MSKQKYGELDIRMKEYYEQIPKTRLMRRTPVAIRIDGKAFHTFTKGFRKPFDSVLVKSMQETTKYLCANIQGCVFGYTQSDEITLILIDYQKFNTSAWFDYEVQKMCSISASMATMAFNKFFRKNAEDCVDDMMLAWNVSSEDKVYMNQLYKAMEKGAMFDSRVFNIPKEEVTNLILWRQNDASKNSIQMVGRAYFSSTDLKKKSCSNIQDMLMDGFGINWNDFPTYLKRGSACLKGAKGWYIDLDMPILKNDGRDYVEKLIYVGEKV